ncbi:hypothetical protein BYI23_E000350 (plasmid) [Burkholderia sp. YI23]|nr:hypothetical protein BYI23_E000350 [Burkholderia sp. YI23]
MRHILSLGQPPKERYMKVAIIIEGGAIREVLADMQSAEILVVDRDTDGCGNENVLCAIDGGPAAVDAMHQALPRSQPTRVQGIFAAAKSKLSKLDSDNAREILKTIYPPAAGETFSDVVDRKGWGNDTELDVLKDFVSEMGLDDQLIDYAKTR